MRSGNLETGRSLLFNVELEADMWIKTLALSVEKNNTSGTFIVVDIAVFHPCDRY